MSMTKVKREKTSRARQLSCIAAFCSPRIFLLEIESWYFDDTWLLILRLWLGIKVGGSRRILERYLRRWDTWLESWLELRRLRLTLLLRRLFTLSRSLCRLRRPEGQNSFAEINIQNRREKKISRKTIPQKKMKRMQYPLSPAWRKVDRRVRIVTGV